MFKRVPIFEVIEDARIWLLFRRLGKLYGSYQRHDDAAGIVVNANHPLSLQRFTAAHEYGHHVLGHVASADDSDRIEASRGDAIEIAAQGFAGEFIMPLQLVNYTLRTMGLPIKPASLSPAQVYQLSLELGVSYRAAITQLVGQAKLSVSRSRELRKVKPLEIKTGLADKRPANSWADVWILDETQDGRQLPVRVQDEIHVTLPETPSTGYVWQLAEHGASVAVVDNRFVSPDGDPGELIGTSGLRHVWLRVQQPGTSRVRLVRRRPWQPDEDRGASFEVEISAAALPTGESADGLAADQKAALLADVDAA